MPQLASLFGPVVAQAEDASLLGYLPLIILGGAFILVLYLPRRRQAKKAAELLAAISVGDEVRTIGGIYGTIRSEDDDTYTLELEGGNSMRVAKRAVAERVGDDAE